MANAREIKKQDQQCSGHNEDYQCHVYDFLFQNEKSQKDICLIRSLISTTCRVRSHVFSDIFRIRSIRFSVSVDLIPTEERKSSDNRGYR